MNFIKVTFVLDKSKANPNDAATLTSHYFISVNDIILLEKISSEQFLVKVRPECRAALPNNIKQIMFSKTTENILAL